MTFILKCDRRSRIALQVLVSVSVILATIISLIYISAVSVGML